MERCSDLIHAERCSLFLVNEDNNRLVSQVHKGLTAPIELPANVGVAGRAFSQQTVVNCSDAYAARFFDSSFDSKTKFKTKAIVAVPIFNQHGSVLGCSEFLNKRGGVPFSNEDVKLIQLFNVFIGISIENNRLYASSIESHARMASLLDTAFSLSKGENIHDMLAGILHNAKTLIGADRATVFSIEPHSSLLTALLVDGPKFNQSIPTDQGLAGLCARSKAPIVENDCHMNPAFNHAIDDESGYVTRSLIAHPLLDSNGEVIGVVELLNKQDGPFTSADLTTVNAFATFASVALQNSRLEAVKQAAGPEAELEKWIAPHERSVYAVPVLLELTAEEQATVMSLNCFAPAFRGIGHFKEIFFFFRMFDFMETFKITAGVLFTFLYEISSRYTNTSYHNWTHACDVSQCITFMLHVAHLRQVYEAWELFTLMVAAICHDTNHHGFNNVYNVKAETPLGILYKEQSVMEMHHITQAIPVISRDDIALFHAFDVLQARKVWNLFIRIILSTDMAHHFEMVKRSSAALDSGTFDMKNPEFRLLGLQLIMKCGDISNVSRPFELADKWCDILNEEFFRQGDLEKETGIGLTSPLNDREKSNKPKSQIGFYNFICLPLYTVLARLFPPLQVQADAVKSNLEKWKELVDAQVQG
jgi:GAF domain-containing protein